MNKLVSVVITTFNHDSHLLDCLNSVLLNHSFIYEIIIVDDCSSNPNSISLLDEIAFNSYPIPVIIHRLPINSGRPSLPRNAGASLCKSPLVCFMDCDDLMHPEYFAVLNKYISLASVIDNSFILSSSRVRFTDPNFNFFRHSSFFGIYVTNKLSSMKYFLSTSGLIVPTHLFQSVSYENIYLEDWRFILSCFSNRIISKYLVVTPPLIAYRVSSSSITPNSKLTQFKRVKNVMNTFQIPIFYLIPYAFFSILKYVYESKILYRVFFRFL